MSFQRISIEQAKDLIKENDVTLLDIRDPDSFAADKIENAVHVSNNNVQEIISNADKHKPLIIYCYHGNSSQGAADFFYNQGFEQAFSVDGGFEEWKFKRET